MQDTGARPFCQVCQTRPRAVAYHKYGRIYYRSRCGHCQRRDRRQKSPQPRWLLSGYKKKNQCDLCHFTARLKAQLLVYHVDGDLNNSDLRNLKTICRNCAVEVTRKDWTWRPGDIEPDR